MIGQALGHYRILEKIGAGGMGEVYEAEDYHLPRRVALKLLPERMVGDSMAVERFIRGAARCGHNYSWTRFAMRVYAENFWPQSRFWNFNSFHFSNPVE